MRDSGLVIWLTGLSGSGKTTLAKQLRDSLASKTRTAVVLDGDELRRTISSDLGFSREDRDEHVRRVAERALEHARNGRIAIVALISPYRKAREAARQLVARHYRFIEIHVDCPLDELRRRDPKGLYARADAGTLPAFSGVSDPYEAPPMPDLRVDTSLLTIEQAVALILGTIESVANSS